MCLRRIGLLSFIFSFSIVSAQTLSSQTLPEGFSETLLQANQDLTSNNEQRRISAAILLGKYNIAESQKILLGAMSDRSAAVRRAAAVSLKEHGRFTQPQDAEKFLAQINDSDVEVRRTVSSLASYVGDVLNHFARISQLNNQAYQLPLALKDKVHAALSDDDAIVRLNTLKSMSRLNLNLKPDEFIKLIQDPEPAVTIASLRLINSIQLNKKHLNQLELLSTSQDTSIKTALLDNLFTTSNREIVNILLTMTDSDEPIFRLSHFVLRARQGTLPDRDEQNQIIHLLVGVLASNDFLERLLREFHLFQSDLINKALTNHNLVTFRQAGWRIILKDMSNKVDHLLLLRGLEDSSSSVRQSIINYLIRMPDDIPSDLLSGMMESSHVNVRNGVAELMVRQSEPPHLRDIFPLIIDQASQVRGGGMRVLIKHRPPGWQKILFRSLSDKDSNVQKQSVSQLFTAGREGLAILQIWSEKNQNTPLARHINSEFTRRRVAPLPPAIINQLKLAI